MGFLDLAGNRTRVLGFAQRTMARDFRCQGSILRRIRCPFESPGVPSSPLESTPVLETFWRRLRRASRLFAYRTVVYQPYCGACASRCARAER